jgi:hypothetical protein
VASKPRLSERMALIPCHKPWSAIDARPIPPPLPKARHGAAPGLANDTLVAFALAGRDGHPYGRVAKLILDVRAVRDTPARESASEPTSTRSVPPGTESSANPLDDREEAVAIPLTGPTRGQPE